ncbi:retinoic acid receptor responder protein 2-like isoform X1 [Bufo bufo]|uniref:retinoic acid receptor responder protein 2-like isoform X1 n=1 Tax=Bufo bufo TaxID=8384 RepID=UPI001ABEABD1|nr:retinoic acid receptor responder protein 2-like isoform X1 [Bufo bufo]XP_040287354.1 retinoic acid receptor responder protein 2-like isoform X1 [Bufo bufo]
MVTMAGWWWIAVLLVMTSVSGRVPVDSLTDPQTDAVRLVREDFHKSNKVKNAFQVSSMLAAKQQENFDGKGTFVKVRFIMKQTNCQRREWMNRKCVPIMTAKRTYNCVGCFTFADGADLLQTGYRKCVRQSHANRKEVRKERRKECAKLKGKKRTYSVGAYSFRSAPLGNYD